MRTTLQPYQHQSGPHPLRVLVFVLMVIILALMISALGPVTQSPANGEEVFKQVCATCHTVDRPTDMEAAKPIAPPMKMIVRRYMMVNETEAAAHARIVTWLEGPSEEKSIMPPMAIEEHGLMPPVVLTEEERIAVASYVLSLHEPGMQGMQGMRHDMPNRADSSNGMGMNGQGMMMHRMDQDGQAGQNGQGMMMHRMDQNGQAGQNGQGMMMHRMDQNGQSGEGMQCDHMQNQGNEGTHSCPGMNGGSDQGMQCKRMNGENNEGMQCPGMKGENGMSDRAMQCPHMKSESSQGDN